MKKNIAKLGVFFGVLGFTIHVVVIIIAISLERKNLGETLASIGLGGLVLVFLGLALMIISLFLRKSIKT